ncbi:MAG: TetR/AcrR family transcriptional regulator [Solirubrobacterales bacterium]|nr:TetR/AcrR family transcriptional regulator [Solirubrobacterales bacterium]
MSATEPRAMRADARRNRERILDVARRLLADKGADVQIDDIARTAGVGVGTFYRHFPTKDALIGELLVRKFRDRAEQIDRFREIEDPWEAFTAFVHDSAEKMAADAAEQNMWWAVTPEAMEYALGDRNALFERVRQLVARGHEAGVLREDFEASDFPTIMCGLGANMQAARQHAEVLGDERHDWRRLLEYVLDGVRAR